MYRPCALTKSKLTVVFLLGAMMTGSRLSADGRNSPSSIPHAAEEDGTLLLVRSWDPQRGELIGWMPSYRAAIKLKYLAGEQPHLELNDAATMVLPHPPHRPPSVIQITPEDELLYQGRRWLPVERETNLVRIGKTSFYIVSIIFGDSRWRRATTTQ
jgi:hypothetical protein